MIIGDRTPENGEKKAGHKARQETEDLPPKGKVHDSANMVAHVSATIKSGFLFIRGAGEGHSLQEDA